MEMTLTPAYSVSRQPVSCRKSFRLRPARIFASITIPFVLPDLPAILGCVVLPCRIDIHNMVVQFSELAPL
jgi:hypothetical protein